MVLIKAMWNLLNYSMNKSANELAKARHSIEEGCKSMILKSKDTRTEDIQELNRLLTLNISSKQRGLQLKDGKQLINVLVASGVRYIYIIKFS